MPVVVVATIVPKPDHLKSVRAVLLNSIPEVHEEEGCELYALHEASAALIFVEQWSSQAALDQHSAGSAVRRVQAAIEGRLMKSPTLVTGTPIPAGATHLGRLVVD
jgi:quinol monooxygenase YgiN